MENIRIERLTAADWSDIARIYADGIATGQATFEKRVPDWTAWDNAHRKDCRIVAAEGNRVVVGWTALSNISPRNVYAGVAEVSLYVDHQHWRTGIGNLLLKTLITQSETAGIWTLQAGIFPENEASLRLHKRNGFRTVGVHEKLGQLDGRWRDVVLLERRSRIDKLS